MGTDFVVFVGIKTDIMSLILTQELQKQPVQNAGLIIKTNYLQLKSSKYYTALAK